PIFDVTLLRRMLSLPCVEARRSRTVLGNTGGSASRFTETRRTLGDRAPVVDRLDVREVADQETPVRGHRSDPDDRTAVENDHLGNAMLRLVPRSPTGAGGVGLWPAPAGSPYVPLV